MNKQLVSLASNVLFVSPGSKTKTFQEVQGSATGTQRPPFNAEVANRIRSLPFIQGAEPVYQGQIQLNVEGNIVESGICDEGHNSFRNFSYLETSSWF